MLQVKVLSSAGVQIDISGILLVSQTLTLDKTCSYLSLEHMRHPTWLFLIRIRCRNMHITFRSRFKLKKLRLSKLGYYFLLGKNLSKQNRQMRVKGDQIMDKECFLLQSPKKSNLAKSLSWSRSNHVFSHFRKNCMREHT